MGGGLGGEAARPGIVETGRVASAKQVKADLNSKTLPTVMFTSSREERDSVMGYDRGASAYVIKLARSHDLVNATREQELFRTGVAHPRAGRIDRRGRL
jgi:PleD family two-component response regulator